MTDQNPLAIAVTGVSGRMGQMLVRAIAERAAAGQGDAVLAGATERPGHPWIGRDLGEAMGGQANGITVSDDPDHTIATIGCNGLIIVRTKDVTLVCPVSEAERVKDLAGIVDKKLQ